jgi:hypothetical protein
VVAFDHGNVVGLLVLDEETGVLGLRVQRVEGDDRASEVEWGEQGFEGGDLVGRVADLALGDDLPSAVMAARRWTWVSSGRQAPRTVLPSAASARRGCRAGAWAGAGLRPWTSRQRARRTRPVPGRRPGDGDGRRADSGRGPRPGAGAGPDARRERAVTRWRVGSGQLGSTMMVWQARSSVAVIGDSTPHDHPEVVPASVRSAQRTDEPHQLSGPASTRTGPRNDSALLSGYP